MSLKSAFLKLPNGAYYPLGQLYDKACLVPVRRLRRPSRSMHFGYISENKTRSEHVTRNASGARGIMRFRDWDEATSPAIKSPFLSRINTEGKISFWLQTLDLLHVVEHE